MKLDKEKLSALSSLPNAKMWNEIRRIAGERGFKLPEEVPPPETMEKLRRAMSGAERISLSEAAKIMQNYRKR